MLTTVVVVVATHDLSLGVLAGVLLSGIFFTGKVQRMFSVARDLFEDGTRATYRVTGEISSHQWVASPELSRPKIAQSGW